MGRALRLGGLGLASSGAPPGFCKRMRLEDVTIVASFAYPTPVNRAGSARMAHFAALFAVTTREHRETRRSARRAKGNTVAELVSDGR